MEQEPKILKRVHAERGVSLVLVALCIVMLFGAAAISIDLASLYVARNECQRAADAAALAGAKAFVDSGCVTAGSCATYQPVATQRAQDSAAQNFIGGDQFDPVSFPSCFATSFPVSTAGPNAGNPLITVKISRTNACGDSIPTFYARIMNAAILTADVSASATAEAFNPSSALTYPTICVSCMLPVAVPNCDIYHTANAGLRNVNTYCNAIGTSNNNYFVNPGTGAVENPGNYSGPNSGGVVGEVWTLNSINFGGMTPPQWGVLNDTASGCGANYANCITTCTTSEWACGSTMTALNTTADGAGVLTALDTLIHAAGPGAVACGGRIGQDCITFNPFTVPPYTIAAGVLNAYGLPANSLVSSSNSLVSVPIYDGATATNWTSLHNGSGGNVTIVGFMQLFIEYVLTSGTDYEIQAMILNVTGCGTRVGSCASTNGSSTATVKGGGQNLIPIRLVTTQ